MSLRQVDASLSQVEMLNQEMQVLIKLKHKRIVKFYVILHASDGLIAHGIR